MRHLIWLEIADAQPLVELLSGMVVEAVVLWQERGWGTTLRVSVAVCVGWCVEKGPSKRLPGRQMLQVTVNSRQLQLKRQQYWPAMCRRRAACCGPACRRAGSA